MQSSPVFRVRSTAFGAGRPKICIPLTSPDQTTLEQDLQTLQGLPHDLVEWRADCFGLHRDKAALRHALQTLRDALGETPLLFTFRTKAEGGSASLDFASYASLNREAASSGLVDLVDVELFSADREDVKLLVSMLQTRGVGVVVSTHDFEKTPSAEEITRRLLLAKEL